MKILYPAREPYNTDYLQVSSKHKIYFEQCGSPNGKNIVFLHGGPGGGIAPEHRQYFNPEKWNLTLFDQRSCGKSIPFASLEENTTDDLIEDMEKLREKLKIKKWCVFGGSWGSTLALAYAIKHPERCSALFLRGIFLLRKKEIDWFYQAGASRIFPDAWENYIKDIPHTERDNLLQAYYKRLTSNNIEERISAAKSWSCWEAATSKLIQDANLIDSFSDEKFATAFARIESHYFTNKGFFPEDNYLLNNINKIRKIPGFIVHGRYDIVCPVESAWELSKLWPEADLKIIPDAGHALNETNITKAILKNLDSF
ncbi:MAG: prolyl aminopeptidase [Zetaproteobacteria bacterium]|nr:prolyl aminopeptidase [Pseudobdellovibrionaceae bacterium]